MNRVDEPVRSEDEQPGKFRLTEVPVVIVVIVIALTLLLPALHNVREAASKLQVAMAGRTLRQ